MEKYKALVKIDRVEPGDIGIVEKLHSVDIDDDGEEREITTEFVFFNDEDVFRRDSFPLSYVENHPEYFAKYIGKSEEEFDLYEGDIAWVYDENKDELTGPEALTGNYHKQVYFVNESAAQSYVESKRLYDKLKMSGWTKDAWIKHKKSGLVFTLKQFAYINSELCVLSNDSNEQSFLAKECELIEIDFPDNIKDVPRYDGYVLDRHGELLSVDNIEYIKDHILDPENLDVYPTKQKALSGAAFIQLSQLHHELTERFNKAIGCDWFKNKTSQYWIVIRSNNSLIAAPTYALYNPFPFPTEEMAKQALQSWKHLWNQYYELN